MDLPATTVNGSTEYEQVIWSPYLQDTALIVNTYVNASNALTSCETSKSTGYTYALNNSSGSGLTHFWPPDNLPPGSRHQLGATGSPLIITVNKKPYLVSKDKSGQVFLTKVHLGSGATTIRRIAWREITKTYMK